MEIPHLPQVPTIPSVDLKNTTFLKGKCLEMKNQKRERLQRVLSNATAAGQHHGGGGEPRNWCLRAATSVGTCSRSCPRTICQAQPRLCALGILVWKNIPYGYPINGLLQEKEQGPG